MQCKNAVVLVAGMLVGSSVLAAEYEVAQENKDFTVKQMEIKVGDVVSFPNHDDFHHNVFSISDAKTFDLGSYDKGATRKVTFDTPGTVQVECAIHPSMQMTIEVKE